MVLTHDVSQFCYVGVKQVTSLLSMLLRVLLIDAIALLAAITPCNKISCVNAYTVFTVIVFQHRMLAPKDTTLRNYCPRNRAMNVMDPNEQQVGIGIKWKKQGCF